MNAFLTRLIDQCISQDVIKPQDAYISLWFRFAHFLFAQYYPFVLSGIGDRQG